MTSSVASDSALLPHPGRQFPRTRYKEIETKKARPHSQPGPSISRSNWAKGYNAVSSAADNGHSASKLLPRVSLQKPPRDRFVTIRPQQTVTNQYRPYRAIVGKRL